MATMRAGSASTPPGAEAGKTSRYMWCSNGLCVHLMLLLWRLPRVNAWACCFDAPRLTSGRLCARHGWHGCMVPEK